nr:aminodeoxychorismate synthase component I [Thiohalomonas denitrificans]
MPAPYLCSELPYRADSGELFGAVADRAWSMLLDSAGCGRFDILVADPFLTLTTEGRSTTITPREGASKTVEGNPLALVRRYLGPQMRPLPDGIPFAGGALGYFAYDLACYLEDSPDRERPAAALPEMAIGLYDWALVVDHRQQKTRLVSSCRDPHTRATWAEWVKTFEVPAIPRMRRFQTLGTPESNLTREAYLERLARIQRYLVEGDCYQVNFAQTFSASVSGDLWAAYRQLRHINSAPFAAYLNTPSGQVLSASPERFLQVRAGSVETRPIKGTRPRHEEAGRDRQLAAELGESPKDRAENVMIVDLLRNDLGKSCATGSIRVPELFKVESFASVHHLVSSVTGRLAPEKDALDLLEGCFPGGSITGAPKRRAMEIIEELEPEPRGLYCGSIGYIGFDGAMDTNIAIRTLVHSDGEIRFAAGGGIVMDSDPEAEYQESFDKAARLLALLEAFITIDTNGG